MEFISNSTTVAEILTNLIVDYRKASQCSLCRGFKWGQDMFILNFSQN